MDHVIAKPKVIKVGNAVYSIAIYKDENGEYFIRKCEIMFGIKVPVEFDTYALSLEGALTLQAYIENQITKTIFN